MAKFAFPEICAIIAIIPQQSNVKGRHMRVQTPKTCILVVAAFLAGSSAGADDIWGPGNPVSNVQGGTPVGPPPPILSLPSIEGAKGLGGVRGLEAQPSQNECTSHFAAVATSDDREWARIGREVVRSDQREALWRSHLSKRDAVSSTCVKLYPGRFEAQNIAVLTRNPGGAETRFETSRLVVPPPCRFAFQNVEVTRAANGDHSITAVSIDGYTYRTGFNSSFQSSFTGPQFSESVAAKLGFMCDRYLEESALSRRALRRLDEAIDEILRAYGYSNAPSRLRTPDGSGGPRG